MTKGKNLFIVILVVVCLFGCEECRFQINDHVSVRGSGTLGGDCLGLAFNETHGDACTPVKFETGKGVVMAQPNGDNWRYYVCEEGGESQRCGYFPENKLSFRTAWGD